MGDPHNTARYGETWPQHRIDAYLEVLVELKPYVVLSGGWAWHFMSPLDHRELKHAHDHKDVDLMVPKKMVGVVMALLQRLGFEKVATRYDHLPSDEDFRRYEKLVTRRRSPIDPTEDTFRLTIDFFVKDVPEREIDGWRVVDPSTLITFYSSFHGSKACFAVQAAKKLLDRGLDPVGREELVVIPTSP